MSPHQLIWRFRCMMILFIVGLILSGITAFPLRWELNTLAAWMGIEANPDLNTLSGIHYWIAYIGEGLEQSYNTYPFLAYGTDWLAFAHIVIAIFFIGPLKEPTRHDWTLISGIVACIGIIPLAMICGPLRGIPFYWRMIDCMFGVIGIIPLLYCLRISRHLKRLHY